MKSTDCICLLRVDWSRLDLVGLGGVALGSIGSHLIELGHFVIRLSCRLWMDWFDCVIVIMWRSDWLDWLDSLIDALTVLFWVIRFLILSNTVRMAWPHPIDWNRFDPTSSDTIASDWMVVGSIAFWLTRSNSFRLDQMKTGINLNLTRLSHWPHWINWTDSDLFDRKKLDLIQLCPIELDWTRSDLIGCECIRVDSTGLFG